MDAFTLDPTRVRDLSGRLLDDRGRLRVVPAPAQELLGLAPSALHASVRAGELHEVNDDEKDEVSDS
jgi:hypothetical protein